MRTIIALALPLTLIACTDSPGAGTNTEAGAPTVPTSSDRAALSTLTSHTACSRAHALRVPAQFPTIQAAVNAAKPGQTVAVAAGTYTESVVMQPGVCLLGAGPAFTVLDAKGGGQNLVDMSIAPNSAVTGFTFRGTTSDVGCPSDDPFECSGQFYRAGVFVSGEGVGGAILQPGQVAPSAQAPALIFGNVFTRNTIGVMLNFHGIGVVRNNVFVGNDSALVANHFQDHTLVANNVFLDNAALAIGNQAAFLDIQHNILVGSDVAIRFELAQTGEIRDNVFFHNGADQHDDFDAPPRFTIGQDGNVDLDPQFADAAAGDFHLKLGGDAGVFGGPLASAINL